MSMDDEIIYLLRHLTKKATIIITNQLHFSVISQKHIHAPLKPILLGASDTEIPSNHSHIEKDLNTGRMTLVLF
jgi:uncharacterized protein YueI